MLPSEFARDFMDTVLEQGIIPLGETDITEDYPFITYRRFLQLPPSVHMDPRSGPVNNYTEVTGNDSTGTAYYIQFESPLSRWAEDLEVGKVILENRILDKSL